MPNGTCYKHGGATPGGIASVHFKTGMRSKYMPKGLMSRWQEAMRDPQLLSLDRDVALVEARLMEVVKGTGEGNSNWVKLGERRTAILEARRTNDMKSVGENLNQLLELISTGCTEEERWKEIIDRLVEQRRKLIDSIHKHQVQAAQIVTLSEMQILFTGLAQIVRQSFVNLMAQLQEDREKKAAQKALAEISDGFTRLTNATGPRQPDRAQPSVQ